MSEFVCVADYERYAEETLPKIVREYISGGANDEYSVGENVAAFKRYRFRPRYMLDVSELQLSTSLLGQKVSCPIGVSPMGMLRLAHPDGEVALARACEAEQLAFTLSMAATTSVEELGQAAPGGTRWIQVHVLRDRQMMRRVIARAERAGFSAVVLTVDCDVHGKRHKEAQNHFSLPSHLTLPNIVEDLNQKRIALGADESKDDWSQFCDSVLNPACTWTDIQWLKSVSPLPVVAKGVMTGSDALLALEHGADAVWVSNHGGRELDYLAAPIDALGEVVSAVQGKAEVYLDGGVRTGLDVLKALARGARAVFCGRPAAWGMTHSGKEGAQHVLKILQEELTVGMALAGVTDIQQIPSDTVVHQSYYSKY